MIGCDESLANFKNWYISIWKFAKFVSTIFSELRLAYIETTRYFPWENFKRPEIRKSSRVVEEIKP